MLSAPRNLLTRTMLTLKTCCEELCGVPRGPTAPREIWSFFMTNRRLLVIFPGIGQQRRILLDTVGLFQVRCGIGRVMQRRFLLVAEHGAVDWRNRSDGSHGLDIESSCEDRRRRVAIDSEDGHLSAEIWRAGKWMTSVPRSGREADLELEMDWVGLEGLAVVDVESRVDALWAPSPDSERAATWLSCPARLVL
ncbi:hypothetical protein KCU88_g310, partial [Aureobasidium melanogenum]